MFQIAFDLVLIVCGILFLRWLYYKWFSPAERERSNELVSKKVELNELRKRKEDLEERVGVTEEVKALQTEVVQKEKVLKSLE